MYRQDIVYIWINQVGKYAHLNGTETMVVSDAKVAKCEDGVIRTVWDTTTPSGRPGGYMWAYAGDLIPRKDTPPGELKILELFKPTVKDLPHELTPA